MNILAIDPGTFQSAVIIWDGKRIVFKAIYPNKKVAEYLMVLIYDVAVIEMVACYGMPVGKSVFDTLIWVGRFIEKIDIRGIKQVLVFRRQIKLHFCNSIRAKDSNIRQVLIDRFGPPGVKKAPGLTYGLRKDMWSAFAISAYWFDTHSKI